MASETSKSRRWRYQNGETIAVGSFAQLNANNARLLLESGDHLDVPLVDLHREDLVFILAPPRDTNLLGAGALSSVREPDNEPPFTISAQTFPLLAKSSNPILWPISQFRKSVMDPNSGLDALLNARVTHATSYHEPGAVGHDYVVVRIHSGTDILTEANHIWLRCQRNPGAYNQGANDQGANIARLYRLLRANRRIAAVDSVKFCFDESKLRNTNDTFILTSRFENVQLEDLLFLLEIIHSVSPSYDLLSRNSWWFSDVIIKTLDRLGENGDNRVQLGLWRRLTMALGAGTEKSTHEVAKRFLDLNTPSRPPLGSSPSHSSASLVFTEKYSSLGDVGAVISESSPSSIDPFVRTVRTLGVMDCPVATLCGLIRSNPATRDGRIHGLVRRRRTKGVRHEFILLRVGIPNMTDMWIRLERSARARTGSPVASVSHLNFPTNDTCKVSEKDSSLLADVSFIAAIVEFRNPPSLDNLQRLLTIISEESKTYNVLKENCWFYAATIQDVLTKWCDGILQGTISHLKFGEEARERIYARRDDVMNPSRDT